MKVRNGKQPVVPLVICPSLRRRVSFSLTVPLLLSIGACVDVHETRPVATSSGEGRSLYLNAPATGAQISRSTTTSNRRTPGPAAEDSWNTADVAIGPEAGYLSQLERDVLLHLNLARSDPKRYAATYLEPRRALFEGKIYRDPFKAPGTGVQTAEGARAVELAVQAMQSTPSMSPLVPSQALTGAAGEHAADQSRTGETGHTGSDGSIPVSRAERQGLRERAIGEVIAYGPVSGRDVVGGLLIDDGVQSRGHRVNILNPRFQLVGIDVAPHPQYGHVVVVDLASNASTGF